MIHTKSLSKSFLEVIGFNKQPLTVEFISKRKIFKPKRSNTVRIKTEGLK